MKRALIASAAAAVAIATGVTLTTAGGASASGPIGGPLPLAVPSVPAAVTNLLPATGGGLAGVLPSVESSLPPVLPTTTQTSPAHAFGGSGITGSMTVTDNGTYMLINATAQGMTPGTVYVSLFYGLGSNSTQANQCNSDQTLQLDQMLIGPWIVDPSGNGVLSVPAKTGVRLSQVGTWSIREATLSQLQQLQLSAQSKAIAPTLLKLDGCGGFNGR